MKKLIIGLLALFVIVNVQAQDAKQVIKDAEKALDNFLDNPTGNEAAAKEAIATMEANFGTPEDVKYYIKKAEIYEDIVEAEEKIKLLNPTYALVFPEAPLNAFNIYKSVLTMGDKEKDALKGIERVMTSINNLGISAFEEKRYQESFNYYDTVTEAHKILKENDKDSMLDDEAQYNQHKFYTSVAGYYAGLSDDIMPYLKDLYDAKYDHSFIYEALFNTTVNTDKEAAAQYLKEGREKYPDEKGLLYAEINYYLGEGELEVPINRIKEAIASDPENISLYTTLGNVYDQLNQQEREAGNVEKANEYFNLAYEQFQKAMELDPNNFDSQYSIGALYYNKAASLTGIINELASDYSAEGTKKYNTLKEEMDGYFNEALPYFEKAHEIDATDQNSLIALREIYARKSMFDKVEEIKAMLEALGG